MRIWGILGITGLLRLGKPSEIIEPKHSPALPNPPNPCPQVPHPTLNLSGNSDSTASLVILSQRPTTLSVEKYSLKPGLNLLWHNLGLFPLVPPLVPSGKRPIPAGSVLLYGVVESRQSSILNGKHSQELQTADVFPGILRDNATDQP